MINEMHCKLAVWLCENHKVILLPTFETSQKVVKKKKQQYKGRKEPPANYQKRAPSGEEDKENKNAPEETKECEKIYKNLKCNISSKTAHNMLIWSHHWFKQHLKHKLRKFPGQHLVLVSEAWTSKTCAGCGWVNHALGGSKCFICSGGACNGSNVDRD